MKTLATMAFAASLATFAGEPPALPHPATIVRDIAYAPENGEFGLCDLWLPASPQPDGAALPSGHPPVVLAIHGDISHQTCPAWVTGRGILRAEPPATVLFFR